MGRPVESNGHLLCHCQSGQDCKTMEHGSHEHLEDICGSPKRRRGKSYAQYSGVLSLLGHQSVRFHPNSLYLGTASSDWTARLWDVQRGTCVRVFIGHQDIVSTLAFSPDGRYLASAGEDLSINLWDLGSGKRIKKMTGHTASIYSLAFSAESTVLVSGAADWTVRCWDVKSAGGLPGKRENGAVNGASDDAPEGAKDGQDSNHT